MNADEQKTFDYLVKAVKRGVGAEIERRAETGSKVGHGERGRSVVDGGTSTGWKDDQGNHVALLSHGDRLSSRGHVFDGALPSSALGHVVKHLATGDQSGLDALHERYNIDASLLGGSDGEGGYWTSPALAATVIDSARAQSVALRAGVRTVPMTSSEFRMVRVENDPTIGFVGEGNQIPKTEIPFGALRLVARKLATVVTVSSELLEDASNLSEELDRLLGEAMAGVIDQAILAGDGKKGGIVGILGSSGIQEEPAPSVKRLSWLNLLDSLEKLETANLGEDTSLILPPAMLRQLRGQLDLNGRFMPVPVDLEDTPRFSTTRLPATSGIHGRFAEVVLGVRSQLSIQVSRHAEFEKDKIAIRARWRGDVGLMRPAALVHLSGFDGTTP